MTSNVKFLLLNNYGKTLSDKPKGHKERGDTGNFKSPVVEADREITFVLNKLEGSSGLGVGKLDRTEVDVNYIGDVSEVRFIYLVTS